MVATDRDPLRDLTTRTIEVPNRQFPVGLLSEIDRTQPKNILLVGAMGALPKVFLVDGFAAVQEHFPNVRFIGSDVEPFWPDQASQLALPWHQESPYISAESLDRDLRHGNLNFIYPKGQQIAIDGVILSLPPSLHLEYMNKWLEKKVPTWVEKPAILPDQLGHASKIIERSQYAFLADFMEDSPALQYALDNDLFSDIGDIVRLSGKMLENWPIEDGRGGWLLDKKISGGGIGIDMGVHSFAVADVVFAAVGIENEIVIENAILGRYEGGDPLQGSQETYFCAEGHVKDNKGRRIAVNISAGKGTNEYYYGFTVIGKNGQIEVNTGSKKNDPYIRLKTPGKDVMYTFPGQGVGYGGTFFDFFLMVHGSKKSSFTPLGARKLAGIRSVKYVADAYALNKRMVPYHVNGEPPRVFRS